MEKDELEIFLDLVTDENFRDLAIKPGTSHSTISRWMESNPENLEEIRAAKMFVEQIQFNVQQLDHPETNALLKKIMDHPI